MTNATGDKPDDDTRRLLYEMSLRNIEFCKLQQWRVANYTLLIFAALISLPHLSDSVRPLLAVHYIPIAILLTLLAAIAGVVLEWQLDLDQQNERDEAHKQACCLIGETKYCGPRHQSITILLSVVIVVGAVLAAMFLCLIPTP